MKQGRYSAWLVRAPLPGWRAALAVVLAIALPTLIRGAMNVAVEGCEFTPFLPFVFLSAVLLKWWQAALVAFGAVMIGFALGTPYAHLSTSCFQVSASVFLASSTALIAAALMVRHAVAALHARGADEADGGIVFSLDGNAVWATWYGLDEPVRLGSQHKVEMMMADFLAQSEAARRLNHQFQGQVRTI